MHRMDRIAGMGMGRGWAGIGWDVDGRAEVGMEMGRMDRIPGMAKGRDEQDCHDGDGRG